MLLPHGGELGGISIDGGSIIIGQATYRGDGDRVYLAFSRIDSKNGSIKKIAANALDAGSFAPGIQGEEFTGGGTKMAASLGLSMFSGMADTLTDREPVANPYGGSQTKPSMRNALLQGLSRSAQDRAGRSASAIEQERNYVLIPEGKEMIIELLEDFKK